MRKAALLVAATLASAGGAAEWPGFRGGPANTAFRIFPDVAGPSAPWVFRPSDEVRGYAHETGVYGSPAVAVVDGGARLFVGCYDHNVYALDVATGREVWRYSTGAPVYATPCVAEVAGGEAVYVGSTDRFLYAIDARGGSKLWARQLVQWRASVGRASLASPALFKRDGRPAILLCAWVYDRSAVRSLEEAAATAYDAETGRPLWKLVLGASELASPTTFRLDGHWFGAVGGADGRIWCLDLDRGQILWRKLLQGPVVSSPAIVLPPEVSGEADRPASNGRALVLVGSRYGIMHAFDARSGEEAWSFRARQGIDSTVAVAEVGGVVTAYFGSHDQVLYALSAQTGDLLWRFQTKGDVYSSPTVFRSGGRDLVAFASGDDHLYLLDASRGTEVWRVTPGRYMWGYRVVGDGTWASPVAVEASGQASLLLPFYDGAVHAYPLQTDLPTSEARDLQYGKQMLGRAALVMVGTMLLCVWLYRRDRAPKRGRRGTQ